MATRGEAKRKVVWGSEQSTPVQKQKSAKDWAVHYPVIISGSQALTNSAQLASMVASSFVLRTSAPGIGEHPFTVNTLLTSISVSPKTCTWMIETQMITRYGQEEQFCIKDYSIMCSGLAVPCLCPRPFAIRKYVWATSNIVLINYTPHTHLVSNLNHWIFFRLWKWPLPSGTLNVKW